MCFNLLHRRKKSCVVPKTEKSSPRTTRRLNIQMRITITVCISFMSSGNYLEVCLQNIKICSLICIDSRGRICVYNMVHSGGYYDCLLGD